MRRILLCAAMLTVVSATAVAGPPYVSDDPEPTDYQHYEIYLFTDGMSAHDGTKMRSTPEPTTAGGRMLRSLQPRGKQYGATLCLRQLRLRVGEESAHVLLPLGQSLAHLGDVGSTVITSSHSGHRV